MIPSRALESVRDAAFRAIRSLPEAHSPEDVGRRTQFREAMAALVDVVYQVDIEGFTDRHFEQLEDLVQAGANLIQIHLVGVSTNEATEREEQEYFGGLAERLHVALRGIEEGWHPDPAKRPSHEEMMQMLDERLRGVY